MSQGREYMVRIKGNQPDVLAARVEGFADRETRDTEAETLEKAGVIERRSISMGTDEALADYFPDELGFPGAR